MAEPPTPDNGGVVPLLLLLEDAIDAAELGRWSAMVELSEGVGDMVVPSVKREIENREDLAVAKEGRHCHRGI